MTTPENVIEWLEGAERAGYEIGGLWAIGGWTGVAKQIQREIERKAQ